MRPTILARLVLPALSLAACPTGEIVPHAPCADGLALRGQGPFEHCAPADAGDDSSVEPGLDSGLDSGLDAGLDAGPPDHSRHACETCTQDVQCELDHLCVEMYWRDVLRDRRYCLPVRDPGCGWVYSHALFAREGTDGSADNGVCAPNEQFTTCEAVLDMQAGKACDRPTECGDPAIDDDGYCDHNQCTTGCDRDPQAHDCPRDWLCGSISTCERP